MGYKRIKHIKHIIKKWNWLSLSRDICALLFSSRYLFLFFFIFLINVKVCAYYFLNICLILFTIPRKRTGFFTTNSILKYKINFKDSIIILFGWLHNKRFWKNLSTNSFKKPFIKALKLKFLNKKCVII